MRYIFIKDIKKNVKEKHSGIQNPMISKTRTVKGDSSLVGRLEAGQSWWPVKGDSAVVVSRVNKREWRNLWKFDGSLCQVFYFASEIGCSVCWISCSANHMADILANRGAKHITSFVAVFLPPWILAFVFGTTLRYPKTGAS